MKIARRNVFAAALALPAISKTQNAPQADTIRQDELDGIIRAHEDVQRRCLAIKLRLNAGAQVEAGRWGAEADRPNLEMDVVRESAGLYMNGLDMKTETR